METVSHDGRDTAYRYVPQGAESGEDATILYVHGSGATHRIWAAQYGATGPHHPAAALDLSGHGDSDDIDTYPGLGTIDAYAADVVAVADAVDATILVGNSLGGAVVQHVVLETDFEPERIVLAGSGAKLAVLEDLREWLTTDFERAIEFLHDDDRLFHDTDERTLEHSKIEMRETGQTVTRRDFLACHGFDVRDRVDEIDVPTLAVVGEHDGLTPPAYHEYFADTIPDCGYEEIPGAAHLAMAERPGAFNAAIEDFVGYTGRRND